MANTLRVKRGLSSTIPQGQIAEPLFTTDTYDLYIGKGSGGNQRIQNYIASGTTSQYLRGDGSLETHNLDSLTDVIVGSPSNGQVLQYNGTNWVNATSGYITGSATAAGQVGVFSSTSNIAGYTTFTFDTVTDKLSMTNAYVNNNLTVDGQLVIKSESGASAYTRGLKFPDNSYGGTGDTAGLRLTNNGGENIVLELYVGNDSLDTINFAVAAGGSTYNDNVTVNGNKIWNAGNLPSPLSSTGTINSGEIAIFSNGTTVYSDSVLFWDNSLNRLGIGGTSPMAQVGVTTSSGVNAFGYRTSGAAYYEMAMLFDNTSYGHLIQTGRGGSTSARNFTILNNNTILAVDENYNLGLNILTPAIGATGNAAYGIDVYSPSNTVSAGISLKTVTSGTTTSDGFRILMRNDGSVFMFNQESGGLVINAGAGNYEIITNAATNFKIDSSTGKIGIGNPASIAEMLTVNGSIQQSAVTSAMLKANASGKIIAAVANTDYQSAITLTTTGTSGAATFNGTTLNIPQYQAAGNYITGAGNSGYLPKYTGSYTIANSLVYDNGSRVMINTTTDNTVEMLQVNGGIRGTSLRVASNFSSGTAVNVLGQIYVDNRSSQGGNRIFLTPNTTSTTPYVHFYEPFTAFNTNGGISIGTSNAITTTPTNSIMHWDANNLRVGIGTTAPGGQLDVYASGTDLQTYFSQASSGNNNFTRWTRASGPTLIAGVVRSTNDGNQKANTAFIGTSNAYDFLLYSGDLERMRITSGGNVVLGNNAGSGWSTASGRTTLEIYGSSFPLAIHNSLSVGNSYSYNTYWDGTNWRYVGATYSAIYIQDGEGHKFFQNGAGTAGATFTPTERMRITSGGNVGIGTNSPVSTQSGLDISSGGISLVIGADSGSNTRTNATSKVARIASYPYTNANTPSAMMVAANDSTNNALWIGGGSGLLNASTSIEFYTAANNNTAAGTERMRITSGGNVGIGTTSPSYKLHVVGGNFNQAILDNAGEQYTALDFRNNGTTKTDFYYDNTNTAFNIRTRVAGPLIFSTNDTERMRITSGGVTEFKGTDGSIISRMQSSSGMLQFYPYFAAYSGPIIQALNGAGSATVALRVECTTMTVAGNQTVTGTKSFAIEHPLDNKKTLLHYSTESPKADLIYRGKINLVDGKAEVNIDLSSKMTDGTFIALCRNIQCFTTNETGWDMVKGKVIGNILTIESYNPNSTDEISWMVIGERYDESIKNSNMLDNDGDLIVEQQAQIEELKAKLN